MARNGIPHVGQRIDLFSAIKLAVLGVLFLVTLLMLSRGYMKQKVVFKAGETATETIVAAKTIFYENKRETDKRRQMIIETFRPIFLLDDSIAPAVKSNAVRVFEYLRGAESSAASIDAAYRTFIDAFGIAVSYDTFKNLILYYKANNYEVKVSALITKLYEKGVLARTNLSDTTVIKMRNGVTVYKNTAHETSTATIEVDSIQFLEDIYRDLRTIVLETYSFLPRDKIAALTEITGALLKPDMRYDDVMTERKLNELLERSRPAMSIFKKGYVVVNKGEVITEEKLALINVLFKDVAFYNVRLVVLDIVFLALFAALSVLYLRRYIPGVTGNFKEFILIAFEYLLSGFMPFIIHYSVLPEFITRDILAPLPVYVIAWIPVFTIINTLLLGRRSAFFVAFVGSFFAVAVCYGSLFDLFILIAAATATILIVENITKRNDILIAGAIAGGILALGVMVDGIRNETVVLTIVIEALIALGVGAVMGVLATGLLSALEHFLGKATVFRLLELSDLNAPILRRLQMQAPGTYHHSFILSSMVEAACGRIGANALLGRVGAYYHDIGKMEHPLYFIENLTGKENRHRNIKPSLSASIIKSHVRLGVEMAERENLPKEIIAFIEEHHGTTCIKYFYNQSLKQGGNIDKDVFVYAGPKPQTRESAVMMLADSVEAASRTVANPTGTKIEELVRSIINEKMRERELEESGLTLKDLALIEDTFVNEIMTSFHGRISYPDASEIAQREGEAAVASVTPTAPTTSAAPVKPAG